MSLNYHQSSENSSQERHDLYKENKRLKKQLRELLDSVASYRGTQHKFENFELQLLQCQNFKKLISCLVEILPKEFKLDKVSLTLFDPDKIAREMLGPELPYSNQLIFIDTYNNLCLPFKELQAGGIWPGGSIGAMRVQLGSKYELIKLAGFIGGSIKSVAILPLIREDLLIGYLCAGSNNKQRFEPTLAIELLSHLSAVIAICLENTLSREQLHQLSQIDMLTRVKNRRAFDKALRTEISRSQRGKLPLSCLFADLDFFKVVNDTYGHSTGDRALKAVACTVQELLRETDILARIGGEEFTILLPNTEEEKARDIAERIRKRIEAIEIHDDQGMVVKLTTSIGYATWQPAIINGESVDDIHRRLMGTADKAVYKAKQSGRNRVRCVPYAQLRDS
ncbi:MAG: sensor domain-containing diguanylate cyclase [Gammaproteobacteria bacterium]|nr:sensor domain-containing diguanylate cyclase [Gammaproteobacteria bacterium]